MLRIAKLQKAKMYFLLFSCLIGVLVVFRNELKLLFLPDPGKETIYKLSFHDNLAKYAKHIVKLEGFITENQGLQLLPGSSGSIIFSFDKEMHQVCLLRIWFYGDEGEKRPNAIRISTDGGKTFQEVADSGNYIGTVFDLSHYVKRSKNFKLLFEAKNDAPFTSVVFDKIEVVISKGDQVKPLLPNLTVILGLVFLLLIVFSFTFKREFTWRERLAIVFLMLIILLATYLRWNELARVSGAVIDGDARGYLNYAKKMNLFSDSGFYSAQFDKREPLYIFIVRLFLLFFGMSETHLRFVSFVFSLVMIYLTYRIGKEWFNNIVGLTAAFILSIHPYLISLSARGLRAEWFTTLILLFIYYGYIKTNISSCWRVVITGFLTGCILLTRSESFLMLSTILAIYPFLARSKWNLRMVLITITLGISLLMPHLYNIYKKHGNPFYTVNQCARFYANREFMGKPGFPTKMEIIEKGMYAGSKITPFEYYFKLHTPWQFIKYSAIGFTKIHIKMPFCFFSGRGNMKEVLFKVDHLKNNFGVGEMVNFIKFSLSLTRKGIWANFMGIIVFITFLLGLVLIGFSRYWMLYIYMILFQINTAFIAYLGLDLRISVHAYPLTTLYCGFTSYWIYRWLSGKNTYPSRKHCN